MRAFPRAAVLAVATLSAAAPAFAQAPATGVVNTGTPDVFIQSLADTTFAVLRTGQSQAERRERFRSLVQQHFAINQIGDRLIRRYRQKITPAQYQAYKAALPGFIVGAYADRLQSYDSAQFHVLRSVPNGGTTEVYSRVTLPGQSRPIQAVWTLTKDTAGRWRIANLTVEGVNLLLSQEADFSAMVDRQGIDSLVQFMRSRAG
jgi:phospholipid transport system substrate-binding protein